MTIGLEHDLLWLRRRIVHVAVTDHPTASWIAQQLRNAFPEDQAPRYLVHDRDGVFAEVATTVACMNVEAIRTAPRSPWQNGYVERVIGSIRRECLDHVIGVNEAGLRRVLVAYVTYYMCSRRHLRYIFSAPPLVAPDEYTAVAAARASLPATSGAIDAVVSALQPC